MELRKAARTPGCLSAATWSCIRAISGEDDHARCPANKGRDLEAQRFCATGGHEHEGIAAAQQCERSPRLGCGSC